MGIKEINFLSKDYAQLQVGDTVYVLDFAFLAGMQAARKHYSVCNNPYRYNEISYNQWEDGHNVQSELMG